jgi:hypothetical protein
MRKTLQTTLRRLFLTTLMALACVGAAHPAEAQTPLISVSPDSQIVAHGSLLTLEITISAETLELMGYDIAVVFNGDIIRLGSVNEGSLPLGSGHTTFFHWLNPGTPTDSVHVNGAILGTTVNGPGAVIRLELTGYAPSNIRQTAVEIVFSVIRDGVNQDIVHSVAHGWVRVEPPVRAEETSWGRVKSRYR